MRKEAMKRRRSNKMRQAREGQSAPGPTSKAGHRSGSALSTPLPVSPTPSFLNRHSLWVSLALIVLIAVIYAPVCHYDFVDLGDPQYVSENPHVADGLTWQGLRWAFSSIYASYWLPLIFDTRQN
jgi:hypothetical protein